jgi:hypothetical protein
MFKLQSTSRQYTVKLSQAQQDQANEILNTNPYFSEVLDFKQFFIHLLATAAKQNQAAPQPQPLLEEELELAEVYENALVLDLKQNQLELIQYIADHNKLTPQNLLIDEMFIPFVTNGASDFFEIPNRRAVREFLNS